MIRWRCINSSSLVHAFDGEENRVAVCGRKRRFVCGWQLPEDDARRCADCERGLAARGPAVSDENGTVQIVGHLVRFAPGRGFAGVEDLGQTFRCYTVSPYGIDDMNVIDHVVAEVSSTGRSFRFWREGRRTTWRRTRTWRLFVMKAPR